MKNASAWMIIPKLLRTLVRKDVALKPKLLLIAGLVYLISPIDLLPDILLGFGWLDDLVIVPFLGWLSYRSLPKGVQSEIVPENTDNRATSRRMLIYLCILLVVVVVIAMMGDANTSFEPVNSPTTN